MIHLCNKHLLALCYMSDSVRGTAHTSSLILRGRYYDAHRTDEKTEAHRTYELSRVMLLLAEARFQPWSQVYSFSKRKLLP